MLHRYVSFSQSCVDAIRRPVSALAIAGALSTFALVALHPAGAAAIIAQATVAYKCSTNVACVTASNSKNGSAVSASSVNGVGITSTSTNSYGIKGSSGSMAEAGVYGYGDGSATAQGVMGNSPAGLGVEGLSSSGDGVYAQSDSIGLASYVGANRPGGTAIYASELSAYGNAIQAVTASGSSLLIGTNSTSSQDVVSIDSSGSEILAGTLTQSGQPSIRTKTSSGTSVFAYGARTSTPTVEDFGEGRLKGGSGYVALDPTFASTMDRHAKYMVFITPQGDNRGLYVALKSERGFSVRESNGGRSTLDFDYRIVAKPYDSNASRLAPTTAFSGLAHGRPLLRPLATANRGL